MAKDAEVSLLMRIKEFGKEKLTAISKGLKDIKKEAAVTSAAMVGFIGLALKAFSEQESATKALENALANQGFEVAKLSKHYAALASRLQDQSTFADEQITQGIAVAQSMAGQVKITDELIRATLDFATAQGVDLNTAFNLVGKSIGSETNALARYGVEIDASASKEEKLAQITDILSAKFDGAAKAARYTLAGSILAAKMAVGDFLELVGEQFAPFIVKAAESLKDLAKQIQTNQFARLTAITVAIVAALSSSIPVILGVTAAVKGLGLTIGFLANPLGIIALGVATLYTAWQTNFLNIQQVTFGVIGAVTTVFKNFVTNVGNLLSGFGGLLKSVFTFDLDGIKNSAAKIKETLANIADETVEAFKVSYEDKDNIIAESLEKEIDKTKEQEEAKARLAANALRSRMRDAALKREEEQRLDKESFGELQDIKNNMAKRALDQRIEAAKRAEQEEAARIKLIASSLDAFVSGGIQKTASHFVGLIANDFLPGMGGAIGQIFDLLSKGSEEFSEILTNLFKVEFLENIAKNLQILIERLPELITNIVNFIAENMPAIVQNMITAILANLPEIISALIQATIKLAGDPKFHAELAAGIAKGVAGGISNMAGDIGNAFAKGFRDVLKPFKKLLQFLGLWPEDGGGEPISAAGTGAADIRKSPDVIVPTGTFQSTGVSSSHDSTFWTRSQGGLIPRLAHGGLIDNTLIAATPGEFVVNRASSLANSRLLEDINQSNGRSVSRGTSIVINVNGGLLGDSDSARRFAKAIDEQLFKLRQGNESRAFDSAIVR